MEEHKKQFIKDNNVPEDEVFIFKIKELEEIKNIAVGMNLQIKAVDRTTGEILLGF